ncbi:hypothetical protein FRC00_009410, partial [Tulasnella sp. 408]
FDFGMPNNTDYLQSQSTCSTCSIKENKSNYWSPTLYFQSPKNGTFKRVAQRPGPLTGSPNAGMVVYYIQIGTVTSFPKVRDIKAPSYKVNLNPPRVRPGEQNFRMIAGDPFLRSYSDSVDDSRSITFRCLQDDTSGNGPETHGMPTTKCAGGIRSQINFPTCWDGKNIDTPNHKDHVRYANGASFGNFGTGCPSTHPVTIPLLFFETVWDTKPFDNEWVNGQSPFVWSMGDPTGYGYHADYMMGWPEDVLKRAMSQCTDQGGQVSSCSAVTSRTEQEMNDCAQPNRVDEKIDGWLTQLPGCNPVQNGPARATQVTGCGAPTETLALSDVTFLRKDISGWTPVGCASENNGESLLTGPKYTPGAMTVEKCLNYCGTNGYTYAGLKNKSTCSCGNSINTSKFSSSYACNLACDGDPASFCGAVNRIAVYSGSGPVSLPTTTPGPTTTTQQSTTTTPSGAQQTHWGQCGGKDLFPVSLTVSGTPKPTEA